MPSLHPIAPAEFDGFYALLQQSFPPDEYRSIDAQKALLEDPRYTAYAAENLNAIIAVWQFEDFAFIEHFAVSPALRCRGLGSEILRQITDALPCPVCLEAELPDTEMAARRLNFYRRCGFFVNEYPYLQPAYGPDRCPVPLYILTGGGPISEERFHYIRDSLYRSVYHVQDDHSLFPI